jgi:hypothetical protein
MSFWTILNWHLVCNSINLRTLGYLTPRIIVVPVAFNSWKVDEILNFYCPYIVRLLYNTMFTNHVIIVPNMFSMHVPKLLTGIQHYLQNLDV